MSASEAAPDLSGLPMDTLLAGVLARRGELRRDDGLLGPLAYELHNELGPRVCVDAAPVRLNDDGEVEFMAIVRGTGQEAGRLCLIGGGVGYIREDGEWVPESRKEALKRHVWDDVGLEIEPVGDWERPDHAVDDMRPRPDGTVRPGFKVNKATKHLVADRWMVHIVGGELRYGDTAFGREAVGTLWFPAGNLPKPEAFGYNHYDTYAYMAPLAVAALTGNK